MTVKENGITVRYKWLAVQGRKVARQKSVALAAASGKSVAVGRLHRACLDVGTG